MKNKRGISKVVTVTLLILMTIALLILLWVYLAGFLKLDLSDLCIKGEVTIVDACYSESTHEVYLTIKSEYEDEIVDYYNPGITLSDGSDLVFAAWEFGEEACSDVRMNRGEYGIPIAFPDYQDVYVVSYGDADIRDLIPEEVKFYYTVKKGYREVMCSVVSEKAIVECGS